MSPFRAPLLGEFETEVALPCRVEYRLDTDGELAITAIVPLTRALPEDTRLRLAALPPREQRCLETEAEAAASAMKAAIKTDQAVERHEARPRLD